MNNIKSSTPIARSLPRRRVVQGIAWTTPAVVATVAAPAYAASPTPCDKQSAWAAFAADLSRTMGVILDAVKGTITWSATNPSTTATATFIVGVDNPMDNKQEDVTAQPGESITLTVQGIDFSEVTEVRLMRDSKDMPAQNTYTLDPEACTIVAGSLGMGSPLVACDPGLLWEEYLTKPDSQFSYNAATGVITALKYPVLKPVSSEEYTLDKEFLYLWIRTLSGDIVKTEPVSVQPNTTPPLDFAVDIPLGEIMTVLFVRQRKMWDKKTPAAYYWDVYGMGPSISPASCTMEAGSQMGSFYNQEPWGF